MSKNIGNTYDESGAISEKEGLIFIALSEEAEDVIELTLASPISCKDDGKILTILFVSGNSYGGRITPAAAGYGSVDADPWVSVSSNRRGVSISLVAYDGLWYALPYGGYVSFSYS